MIGYDHEHSTLDVVYHATPETVYRFSYILPTAFIGIIAAPSVGTAVANVVKGKPVRKHARPEADPPDELFTGVPMPRTVEVVVPARATAQVKIDGRPMGGGQSTTISDEDAFNAVTNREKKR